MSARPIGWRAAALAATCACTAPAATPARGPEVTGAAARYDWTGYSLAHAGDVNADGRADLLVIAHASGEGGRAMVFFGPVTAPRALDGADFVLRGGTAFSNLGEVASHGGGCDVNGDGADDLLLGAPFADVRDVATSPARSGDNAGRAYLVLGGPGLRGERRADEADVTFLGEEPYDVAGGVVACLGDLDGDGFDDIAIGARGNRRGGQDAGTVYLVYGAPVLPRTVPLAAADAVLLGDQPYDQAGLAVAAVGDLDADGRADLVVGAPNAGAGGAFSGAVYLVRGRAARYAGEVELAQQPRLAPREPGLRAGWSVQRAGDVNGDGVADAVVGSYGVPARRGEPGVAWVVLGGRDLRDARDVDLDARGVRLRGAAPGDRAGVSVTGVADLDGDGLADVLVGAPGAAGDAPRAGRVYVVSGRAQWRSSIALADDARWSVAGQQAGEFFGETVVALGDLDGDGLADFGVAAKSRAGAATATGAVDLFFSRRRGAGGAR